MRLIIGGALALMLVGCQTTQTVPTPQDSAPQKSAANTADTKPSAKTTESTVNAASTKAEVKPPLKLPEATPQSQNDVWQRIGMQLEMDVPRHKRVDYYRNWYLTHPRHLEVVAERAQPFLFLITESVEKRGLPLELALLPVVESSFDPFAYSHGSAAGLWQFVSGTAKMYGLEQNFWYDGRRDVAAATEAALDYLESLNRRFDGNWLHAIAAYNSGGGRVSRAIKANEKRGKPIDFFSLDLPKETSSYVPKLLALADIVANQEQYGLAIPAVANKPVVELVDPKEQLDIAIAANYAGISVKQLQSLNPAYNQWSTAPEGPHQLLLPVDVVDTFSRNLEKNRGKGVKLVRHKVKSGDTLSTLAKKYHTTTGVIKTANNLSSTMIRLGQQLLIPTSVKSEQEYALSAANRLETLQQTPKGRFKQTHTVKSGDSFWSIARKHKVSHTTLAKWNGMSPRDTLRIGQKLVIWKDGSEGAIIRTVVYKVRSGDTISGIASKFKVRSADIVKWNDLNKRKYLQPGQKLKLYVDVTKVSV